MCFFRWRKRFRVRQFINFAKICWPEEMSHFSKIKWKNIYLYLNIFIYIYLNIYIFIYIFWKLNHLKYNIGASSFISNKFNIFYTICLKNKIFWKISWFLLISYLKSPEWKSGAVTSIIHCFFVIFL